MRYWDPDMDNDPRDRDRRDNWVERESNNIPGMLMEEVGSDADDKLWSDHDTTDEESQFIPDLSTPTLPSLDLELPPGLGLDDQAGNEEVKVVEPPPGMAEKLVALKKPKQRPKMARLQVLPNSVHARRVQRMPRALPGNVRTPIPAAQTRLDPDNDCGITQASESKKPFFCWRFARGMCSYGPQCKWLHRLPTQKDHLAGYINIQTDIFGRNRRNHDDLANTTLFVTGIQPLGHDRIGGWPAVERQAWAQFGPFGDIESIKGLPNQGTFFVRYRNRLFAEFAKEVMTGQSMQQMGDGEVLRIKWAKEDPDPVMRQQHLFETLSKDWDNEDVQTQSLEDPSISRAGRFDRQKFVKLSVPGGFYAGAPTGAGPATLSVTEVGQYPDTDMQYPGMQPAQPVEEPQTAGWQWNQATWKWERAPESEDLEPAEGLGSIASYDSESQSDVEDQKDLEQKQALDREVEAADAMLNSNALSSEGNQDRHPAGESDVENRDPEDRDDVALDGHDISAKEEELRRLQAQLAELEQEKARAAEAERQRAREEAQLKAQQFKEAERLRVEEKVRQLKVQREKEAQIEQERLQEQARQEEARKLQEQQAKAEKERIQEQARQEEEARKLREQQEKEEQERIQEQARREEARKLREQQEKEEQERIQEQARQREQQEKEEKLQQQARQREQQEKEEMEKIQEQARQDETRRLQEQLAQMEQEQMRERIEEQERQTSQQDEARLDLVAEKDNEQKRTRDESDSQQFQEQQARDAEAEHRAEFQRMRDEEQGVTIETMPVLENEQVDPFQALDLLRLKVQEARQKREGARHQVELAPGEEFDYVFQPAKAEEVSFEQFQYTTTEQAAYQSLPFSTQHMAPHGAAQEPPKAEAEVQVGRRRKRNRDPKKVESNKEMPPDVNAIDSKEVEVEKTMKDTALANVEQAKSVKNETPAVPLTKRKEEQKLTKKVDQIERPLKGPATLEREQEEGELPSEDRQEDASGKKNKLNSQDDKQKLPQSKVDPQGESRKVDEDQKRNERGDDDRHRRELDRHDRKELSSRRESDRRENDKGHERRGESHHRGRDRREDSGRKAERRGREESSKRERRHEKSDRRSRDRAHSRSSRRRSEHHRSRSRSHSHKKRRRSSSRDRHRRHRSKSAVKKESKGIRFFRRRKSTQSPRSPSSSSVSESPLSPSFPVPLTFPGVPADPTLPPPALSSLASPTAPFASPNVPSATSIVPPPAISSLDSSTVPPAAPADLASSVSSTRPCLVCMFLRLCKKCVFLAPSTLPSELPEQTL